MDTGTIRRLWSVVLDQTVRKLQSQQCVAMGDQPAPQKEIAYTWSVGHPVRELHELIQAVTEFASGAPAKLRLRTPALRKPYLQPGLGLNRCLHRRGDSSFSRNAARRYHNVDAMHELFAQANFQIGRQLPDIRGGGANTSPFIKVTSI